MKRAVGDEVGDHGRRDRRRGHEGYKAVQDRGVGWRACAGPEHAGRLRVVVGTRLRPDRESGMGPSRDPLSEGPLAGG